MKKFLVPTDFSDCSRLAIQYAAHLARKTSAKIFLLHVMEEDEESGGISTSGEWSSTISSPSSIPMMIGHMRETKVLMNDLIQSEQITDIDVVDCIEVGKPSDKIALAAVKYEVDMIIMGTHGASGMKEVFAGSNAEKVVQLSIVPVISIHESSQSEPGKIVFASDFGLEADSVFAHVQAFARIYGSKIVLLNVVTPDGFESNVRSRKKIQAFLDRNNGGTLPFAIYNDENSERGILHYVKENGADLIAIGTHGRGGISTFFNRSISEELVNHSFCPVMTVKFRN